jgi:GNAT superfamily N-acetyltransferase
MKFRVTQVDIRVPENRTLLMYLQYKCLPHDTPMEIDRGHWWVVYTEDDRPVGFAGLIRSYSWVNAGYMCRAGVIRNFQGHGLQKRLIQARIRKARALNWEWLLTDTTDNPASANSLIAMGFKLYEPKAPWANKNSLYWRLNILEGKSRAVKK